MHLPEFTVALVPVGVIIGTALAWRLISAARARATTEDTPEEDLWSETEHWRSAHRQHGWR
jgi:hypothetical protein